MPQPLAFGLAPGDPDGQLVGDAHRLPAGRRLPRRLHHGQHPRRDVVIGLAPRRPERVDQERPVAGTAQRPVAHAELQALEMVPRLDQPVVGDDRQAEPFGHRAGGFLGPLQRGAVQGHPGPFGEIICGRRRHRPPVRGQMVAGQAPVDDAVRVVHFAVAQQVDDGCVGHSAASLPSYRAAADARAAAGRAAAMREMAASSCAAETNQASYGDGGRYTPPSSMAWKNAAYAAGAWSLASANDRTGAGRPRNTENRLPASDRQNGTPASVSASAASLATAAAAAAPAAYTSGVPAWE